MRDVYILGVGTTACGRFPDKGAHILGREAAWAAIKDAGIYPRKIEIAFCGHVYQGMGVGQRTLKEIGLVGQPIINVEGACGSGPPESIRLRFSTPRARAISYWP